MAIDNAAGIPEADYEIKELTARDRKKLHTQFWLIGAFTFFALAIFWFIFNTVISFSGSTDTLFYVVFGLIALFFVGIICYLFWSTYLDLKRGIKYCYIGIVADKRIGTHISKTNGHRTRGGYSYSRTTTKKNYYLTLGNLEHTVSFNEYNQVRTGDRVCLEVSPKKKEVLHFKVLEEKQKEPEQVDRLKTTYIKKDVEKPARAGDIEVVKKLFFKRLKNNLWFLAFPAFMIFLFWSTPSGLFYLFMLPLFIFFLYQAIKLLVSLNKYARFLNYKTKRIITTQVLDKARASSNKSATKNQLVTDMGTIEVPIDVYDQIHQKQVIEMHVAQFLNITFGIRLMNPDPGTYYSLWENK